MTTETDLEALTNRFGIYKVGQSSECVIQVNMIYTILCPNSETDSFPTFIGRKATIGPRGIYRFHRSHFQQCAFCSQNGLPEMGPTRMTCHRKDISWNGPPRSVEVLTVTPVLPNNFVFIWLFVPLLKLIRFYLTHFNLTPSIWNNT